MYSAIIKMHVNSFSQTSVEIYRWQSCEDEPVEVICTVKLQGFESYTFDERLSKETHVMQLWPLSLSLNRYTDYLKCVKPTFIVYYHLFKISNVYVKLHMKS